MALSLTDCEGPRRVIISGGLEGKGSGLEVSMLKGLLWQESGWLPEARPVSSEGCIIILLYDWLARVTRMLLGCGWGYRKEDLYKALKLPGSHPQTSPPEAPEMDLLQSQWRSSSLSSVPSLLV